MAIQPGQLYVVATPIGNLGDITYRAQQTLANVDVIYAEDTRHSLRLLSHFHLRKPLYALHEHNEIKLIEKITQELTQGQSIAIISDAGTPLISDPGRLVVEAMLQRGFTVTPIPGPSAVITALSASGMPADEFTFLGFLPPKAEQRRKYLQSFSNEPRTLVFYEAPHRIVAMLEDLATVFGEERRAVVARELTKIHETILAKPLAELVAEISADKNQQQGEFVVIVAGASLKPEATLSDDHTALLKTLLAEVSLSTAVKLAVAITGAKKNLIYQQAIALTQAKT